MSFQTVLPFRVYRGLKNLNLYQVFRAENFIIGYPKYRSIHHCDLKGQIGYVRDLNCV